MKKNSKFLLLSMAAFFAMTSSAVTSTAHASGFLCLGDKTKCQARQVKRLERRVKNKTAKLDAGQAEGKSQRWLDNGGIREDHLQTKLANKRENLSRLIEENDASGYDPADYGIETTRLRKEKTTVVNHEHEHVVHNETISDDGYFILEDGTRIRESDLKAYGLSAADFLNDGNGQGSKGNGQGDKGNGQGDKGNGQGDKGNGQGDKEEPGTDPNGGGTDPNGGGTDPNGGGTDPNGGGTPPKEEKKKTTGGGDRQPQDGKKDKEKNTTPPKEEKKKSTGGGDRTKESPKKETPPKEEKKKTIGGGDRQPQDDKKAKAAKEKAAKEKAAKEQAAREKAEKEKAAREQAERERLHKEELDRRAKAILLPEVVVIGKRPKQEERPVTCFPDRDREDPKCEPSDEEVSVGGGTIDAKLKGSKSSVETEHSVKVSRHGVSEKTSTKKAKSKGKIKLKGVPMSKSKAASQLLEDFDALFGKDDGGEKIANHVQHRKDGVLETDSEAQRKKQASDSSRAN